MKKLFTLLAVLLLASQSIAATTIVTRAGKGAALTHAELDANLANLKNTADAAQPGSANLTTFAGIAPSANVITLLSAADWSAIRSALSLGTAALVNTGTTVGTVPIATDDGSGNPVITISGVDVPTGSALTVAGVALDVGHLTDTGGLLEQGGASSLSELSDWPTGVSSTEVGYIDGVTSGIQAQINAISVGAPVVSAPAYRDDTCTQGQYAYSTNGLTRYDCVATNTWFASTLTDNLSLSPSAPTLSSATIGANGTAFHLVYNQNVTQGTGYNDSDLNVDCTTAGTDIGLTYVSGNGTNAHVYTLASTVYPGDVCDLDFNGDSDSLENDQGGDLAAIVNGSIINDSAAGGGTVLVGDSTLTVTRSTQGSTGATSMWQQFTATATGNVSTGYAHVWTVASGTNVKMCIWDSTGNTVLECSGDVVPGTTDVGDIEFTFAGTLEITNGTAYRIGTLSNAYARRATDDRTYGPARQTAMSYSSPTATGAGTTSSSLGGLRIWLTD